MSKRQSDYLRSLLATAPNGDLTQPPGRARPGSDSDLADAPSPTPSGMAPSSQLGPDAQSAQPARGMTLLARESALARIATGEIRQVTELKLDPARVRIWKGNARQQTALSEESCRDLIDAMLAEGGQKVPAIVRRVEDDPAHEYEVIAGTRRHWAIAWLRANNYPDMVFLAQVHSLDDESAFRLSDIENRARKDVSDFERACNYRDALEAHYGGRQNRMAERLRLSKGWLSKMLTVANLPDWAVSAFAGPTDIQLKVCYPLAREIAGLTEDDAALAAMKAAAETLQQEQSARQRKGQGGVGPAEVVHALMAARSEAPAREVLYSCDSVHGRPALSVLSSNRNGVTIRLHAGSGASESDLTRMLREALGSLAARGWGLNS